MRRSTVCQLKKCIKCGQLKDIADFGIARNYKSGVNNVCKKCSVEYQRELARRTPGYKEKRRQWWSNWYRKNKEKRRKYAKEYRETHREEVRKWGRRDYKKAVIRTQIRKAKMGGLETNWNYSDWEKLKEKFGYTCLMCGRKEPEIKLTVDHIVPIYCGGSNLLENIQPLCGQCNSSKGTRIINYLS